MTTMQDGKALEILNKIYNSTTILNFGALFSDVTPMFVEPAEPKIGDDVKIRFRTARSNVDRVVMIKDDICIPMKLEKRDDIFDYYATVLRKQQKDYKQLYHSRNYLHFSNNL